MKRWTLTVLVAALGTLANAPLIGAGYGSCCDPCCCDPCCCDPCCDPCCCQPCCDPCGGFWDSCCCGSIEVLGEFLYIRPHQCDLNYVIEDPRVADVDNLFGFLFLPFGKEVGICPDYEAAFRVGGAYFMGDGCKGLEVTYTRLCTSDRSNVVVDGDAGIWPTYGNPRYLKSRLNNASVSGLTGAIDAFANAKVRVEYNSVDGVAVARGWSGCNIWWRGFVGLRWADICIRKDAYYQGTGLLEDTDQPPVASEFAQMHHVFRKTDTWGIGPRVGFDVRYEVLCGFGIGAHVGASLLVGECCAVMRQRDQLTELQTSTLPAFIDEELDVRNSSRHHLFPEWDARLGINYLFCCGNCFSLLVEVGWEFVSYINAVGRVRFNHDGGTDTEVCESFNIDGLYVSFRVAI